MKIVMILDEEFPPDSRVEKEIQSLVDRGFYIYLICSTFDGKSLFEQGNGWEIHRLRMSKLFWRKLKATVIALPFYRWKWKKFVLGVLKKVDIGVVHVHDLPLSKLGYQISQIKDCHLILDQHEYYSDWIVKTAHMNTFLGKIVKAFSNWKKYESKYLNLADMVITVTEPLRENYILEYGINEDKIISTPNTPTLKIFNSENLSRKILERYHSDFVLFYAGGIDILRGIDLVIYALPALREEIPNIKLVLGGKIIRPYDPFETARQVNCDDLIEFIGWIDENELPSYMRASKVCFFTPDPNRTEINNTIATKIYQYAIMGCPQIVSEAKMMREFVVKNGFGYSVASSKDFAEKVISIFKKGSGSLSFNTEAIEYWEKTVTSMLDYYTSLTHKTQDDY